MFNSINTLYEGSGQPSFLERSEESHQAWGALNLRASSLESLLLLPTTLKYGDAALPSRGETVNMHFFDHLLAFIYMTDKPQCQVFKSFIGDTYAICIYVSDPY